jgi:hypothetical protein
MKRNALILFGIAIIFGLVTPQVLSQQADLDEEEYIVVDWLLGDVIDLDSEESQLTVSYIDYDTYEEGEIAISVNKDTDYKNVDSLSGIKVGDIVGIDYKISSSGEVIALNISVEGSG